ncbi:TolC family protein [Novosphingobium sp. G106]|uniref:TolC family protein n=1 Tax=Novosphingobium sp. G106 TaxID=2849500 RepID=UPI001C2DD545|nr:TolC family protein [Novosphingobium sp. G106]MBV1692399.1 TolC family protein [Novosphingobium sp. G106]
MSRILAAIAAVALSIPPVAAQGAPPGSAPLTLEQALAAARSTSPALEAASADLRASSAARRVAGLRPNPSLEAETENVAGSGPYRGFDSAETTVGFALPIELGGKRSARIGVADAQGARTRVDAAIADADVTQRVTQAYIAAVAAERRLGVAREQAQLAGEAYRAASVRVAAGRASPIEQQRADVLRINMDAAAARAERGAIVARETLARLIGRQVDTGLDLAWFDRIDGYGPSAPVNVDGTLALAAADADVATADAQVRLARSQRVGDVTLKAGARRLEATNDNAAVFGVSVPLPLFNSGSASVAQARAELDGAEARRRMARIEAEQAVAQAAAEVANAAADARNAAGPALAAAVEAARIARIGYREGKFGQLDVLDAERTLTETLAAAIDALAAWHDARARLQRLTSAVSPITKRLTP